MIKCYGPSNASIMLVGDYPTKAEMQSENAFSGSIGDTQQIMMGDAARLNSIWKTYYVKIPIEGARIRGKSAEDKRRRDEAFQSALQAHPWKQIIIDEIAAVSPRVIIAAGELAMNGLTGETNIHKRAGSWYRLLPEYENDCWVFCAHHPRETFEANELSPLSQMDYQQFKDKFRNGFKFDDYRIDIVADPNALANYFARIRGAEYVTFDVETFVGIITCIGFCADGYQGVTVPLWMSYRDITAQTKARLLIQVAEFLRSRTPKVNQNIKYDLGRCHALALPVNNIIGDTMLNASILYPEINVGLDMLTRIYTDIGYYKDEGREYNPTASSAEQLLKYNAKDAISTWRIYKAQEQEIGESGRTRIAKSLWRCFFPYVRMENNGILVDNRVRQEKIDKYTKILEFYQSQVDTWAGQPVNCNSAIQVGAFVTKVLKVPLKVKINEVGKESWETGKTALEEAYIGILDDPARRQIVATIIIIRKIYKLLGFLDLALHWDNRLRTSYKLHGTDTGRTATAKTPDYYFLPDDKRKGRKPLGNLGESFQQLPKHGFEFEGVNYGTDYREIFVPDDGMVFIEGDLSQAEARVVDLLAENYEGLEEYGKLDKHKRSASVCFGKPMDEITERERHIGKTGKHAYNLDEGAFALGTRLHIPVNEAQRIINAFSAFDPKIRLVFHETVRKALGSTRRLENPYGRVRDFFGRTSAKLYKEAYATIPQGTISDHLKFDIFCPMDEQFHRRRVKFLCEWHDSLFASVPREMKEEYTEKFVEYGKTAIKLESGTFIRPNYPLVIPVDIGYSEKNWADVMSDKKREKKDAEAAKSKDKVDISN